MMAHNSNKILIIGGVLSLGAALVHVLIIFGGADWYRFFGAGEEFAVMAENGSAVPGLVTAAIAALLASWALYAFSGAGLVRRLPFLRAALLLISAVYLLRGLAVIPAYLFFPEVIDAFLVWSSIICLIFGVSYAVGTRQVWPMLGRNGARPNIKLEPSS